MKQIILMFIMSRINKETFHFFLEMKKHNNKNKYRNKMTYIMKNNLQKESAIYYNNKKFNK